MKKLLLILCLVAIVFTTTNNTAHSKERCGLGLCYVDKEPWKMAWVYDNQHGWVISTSFEKGRVDYFFKEGPYSQNGLNLDKNNMPYKIEITYYPINKTFTITKNIAFEQWDDGAMTFSGKYEGKFKIGSEKFNAITVTLAQEVNGAEDYANYTLWRDL